MNGLVAKRTCSSAALQSSSGGIRGICATTGGASAMNGMSPARRCFLSREAQLGSCLVDCFRDLSGRKAVSVCILLGDLLVSGDSVQWMDHAKHSASQPLPC